MCRQTVPIHVESVCTVKMMFKQSKHMHGESLEDELVIKLFWDMQMENTLEACFEIIYLL